MSFARPNLDYANAFYEKLLINLSKKKKKKKNLEMVH